HRLRAVAIDEGLSPKCRLATPPIPQSRDANQGWDRSRMIDPTVSVIRLLIVFLLAFGIGLERQLRRKPVGFGTFIFVSTGACALTLLAMDIEDSNPLPLLRG